MIEPFSRKTSYFAEENVWLAIGQLLVSIYR